jgi:hypothetical protein
MTRGKLSSNGDSVELEPSMPASNDQFILLANALGEIRDSWVLISLALRDVMTEMPSADRDEILMEVDRYLCRLFEDNRKSSA